MYRIVFVHHLPLMTLFPLTVQTVYLIVTHVLMPHPAYHVQHLDNCQIVSVRTHTLKIN